MSFVRPVPVLIALASLSLAMVLAGAAVAQAQDPSNAVSPVLILPPTPPPRMVSTYPAEGQSVAPGVLILKVVFDQQMSPSAWSFTPAPGAEPMDCVKTPRLLNDQKTFVLLCRVLPGKTYGVTFNAQRPGGFANLGDNTALTATVNFKVGADAPITTIRRAMEAASLQSDQMPVQDAPKAAAGNAGAGR